MATSYKTRQNMNEDNLYKRTIKNNNKINHTSEQVGNVRPVQKPFFYLNCIFATYKNDQPASKSDLPAQNFKKVYEIWLNNIKIIKYLQHHFFHNLTKQNCKTLTPKFGLQGKLLARIFTFS